MPQKNTDNDIEKELAYCKALEKRIENEPSISSIPAVKEKLNLLKETVEDTQENLILSKDKDAKTGHKSADSSFFWIQDPLDNDRRAYHYSGCGNIR